MRRWFKDFNRSLWVEIKNTFYKSFFHFIRFGGLLIIPLLYGFSYIFAFWDPFQNMDKLPIAVVSKEGDPFGEAMGKALERKNNASLGDINLTVKASHIYYDDKDETAGKFDPDKKDLSKYNASIVIPNITHDVYESLWAMTENTTNFEKSAGIARLYTSLLQNKIDIINNFQKNYLIAFGLDISTAMSGTVKLMSKVFYDAIGDPQFIESYEKYLEGSTPTRVFDYHKYRDLFETIESLQSGMDQDLYKIVKQETQMHKYAKYGYGLAPFFISIAMWVGGMVLTFSVHRKVYDKTVRPGMRYFTKWLLITYGIVVQATILMTALWLIGFDKLGFETWFGMYGFAIFSGIIFATIIQGIRFAIPSKNLGIFACIFLLIIQMASAGGLFPIQTQAKIYRVLNAILPMGHSVNIYRELVYHTRVDYVLQQCAYLLIYPAVLLPFAIPMNFKLTRKFYLEHNWDFAHFERKKRKGGNK